MNRVVAAYTYARPMARRMKDAAFRQHQKDHRLDPHVAPINRFVERLQNQDNRWLPEVAPMHAGIDALVISVLRDPGPKTQDGTGSGFLCVENDDPTAERQLELFAHHGISARSVLPWNAYPWYINRAPNAAELNTGADVLCELIRLAPNCRVMLLQGTHAVDVWRRLLRRHPSIMRERSIEAVESIHPGRQALWTPDAVERQARLDKQQAAYRRVAEIVNGS